MKAVSLAFALAMLAMAGCAQLNDGNAHAGATATEEQSPFPKRQPLFVP